MTKDGDQRVVQERWTSRLKSESIFFQQLLIQFGFHDYDFRNPSIIISHKKVRIQNKIAKLPLFQFWTQKVSFTMKWKSVYTRSDYKFLIQWIKKIISGTESNDPSCSQSESGNANFLASNFSFKDELS